MTAPAEKTVRTLAVLAEAVGLSTPENAANIELVGVCALAPGRAGHIAFADGIGQADSLAATAAAVVIVPPGLAPLARVPVLVSDNPKLVFARIAAHFTAARPAPGIHATAVVDGSAQVDAAASIAPHVVIGAGSVVDTDVVIGAGTVVGIGVHVGANTLIASNVSIGDGVQIGARVRIEANAAIGARGFGLVHNGAGWEAIPQMGRVRIGDDVEVGAGTTIDRGALDDTVIGQGVKIDDQVHIGHNCAIGAHTVIAGCTGIAGSCTIGSHCMIGGGVGIGDHVHITDGVIITGASQVPKNIDKSGVYSSTFRAMPAAGWRKRLALFRQLDRIEHRLRRVERSEKFTGDE